MSKYAKFDKDIKKLHGRGLRNFEIAKELNIDSRRVSDRLKRMGLKRNERKFNDKPTPSEEKIFQSMFLGDGSIFKSKNNVNYRVNLAHSPKQKEYFMMKYNRVKDFVGVPYTFEQQYDKRTGKTYEAYKLQSKVNPYFTRMYHKWYKNGVKIIPNDIEDILDDELLAYKFFDDGYVVSSGYGIALSSYSDECIQRFRKAIYNNFGIETKLHKDRSIYIPVKHKQTFYNLVKPYATSDVLYKLGEFRKTPNT